MQHYTLIGKLGEESWENLSVSSIVMSAVGRFIHVNARMCNFIWETKAISIPIISILVGIQAMSSIKWTKRMKLRVIIGLVVVTVLTSASVGIAVGVRDAVSPLKCVSSFLSECGGLAGSHSLALIGVAFRLQNGVKPCKKLVSGTKKEIISNQIAPGVRLIASVPANQLVDDLLSKAQAG